MPYKHTEKHIPRNLDRRVKLTEEDKAEIRLLHSMGDSLKSIGRMFGVTKNTIRAVVDKDFVARKKEYTKGRWELYYNKESHRTYTKGHRHYKQKLAVEGKLEA